MWLLFGWALFAAILLLTAAYEKGFVLFVLFFGLVAYLTSDLAFADIWRMFITNWPMVMTYIGGHFVIGTFWSFFKWDRFVAYRMKGASRGTILPSAGDHQRELGYWIMWWPLSFITTVGEFLFDGVLDWIVDQFKNVYTSIANRHRVPGDN